jgi:phospholipase C
VEQTSATCSTTSASAGDGSRGGDLSIVNGNGTSGCARSTTSLITDVNKKDYSPYDQPFQYYSSTANPDHLRPTSVGAIGQTDRANHQYDVRDFFSALNQGVLPAVSFIKANAIQDSHAGYSSPLDEQQFNC